MASGPTPSKSTETKVDTSVDLSGIGPAGPTATVTTKEALLPHAHAPSLGAGLRALAPSGRRYSVAAGAAYDIKDYELLGGFDEKVFRNKRYRKYIAGKKEYLREFGQMEKDMRAGGVKEIE